MHRRARPHTRRTHSNLPQPPPPPAQRKDRRHAPLPNATSPRPITRARVTPGTEHVNPHLPPQFTSFLSNVAPAQRETLGLKKILEGCPNCTYSTLMSHLGTANATCLRYHILGTCTLFNCSKAHAPISIIIIHID
jgi:hypothetical protein